jgi:hypothetical protein
MMKALSVYQPWATLLMLGAKRYEIRSWHTEHRGPLAIHSSRRIPPELRLLCGREPWRGILRAAGFCTWMDLPCGVLLGTVDLVRCLRVEEAFALGLLGTDATLPDKLSGQWAWEMARPRRLAASVAARGRLGLFDVSVAFPET